MHGQQIVQPQSISVGELVEASGLGLQLEILCGGDGLAKRISSPRIQRLGLALAGYTQYIRAGRIHLLGGSETNYWSILDHGAREKALCGLRALSLCCIVITKGLEAPDGLCELAGERGFALLRASDLSSVVIRRIADFLAARLAPVTTLHGVFVEVFGLGVLIVGPSGIGKSECALELVLRGHRLIADDSVVITSRGAERLVGAAGPVLQYHMEVRGIGIIDIRELFGVSAVSEQHAVDFVIRLEKWKPEGEYDRLGLDPRTLEVLGTAVPVSDIPVAPGRNISTLVEVAARTHLLHRHGQRISKELATEP
jgi:HPr kinase/phosphorylase